MKKRIITAMAVLALTFGPMFMQSTQAQVLIMDMEEEANSNRADGDQTWLSLPTIPELGSTFDQYAPLGSGMLVLGCLGGAYLLGKRRKED